jgi:hypothetical protein
VVRVHADTLAGVAIPGTGSKGIAIDTQGRVFAVLGAAVHLIEPGKTAAAADYKLTKNVVTLKGAAYAYSDMTGTQTRLAANEPGWYRETFAPCADGTTEWKYLTWDVEAPKGTWAMFNIRAADTTAGLKSAPWYTIACISPPGGAGQATIGNIKSKVIEVEVRFVASGDLNHPETVQSARIKSFGVLHRCVKLE